MHYYYRYLIRWDKILVKGGAPAALIQHKRALGWQLAVALIPIHSEAKSQCLCETCVKYPFFMHCNERAPQICSQMNVLMSNGNPHMSIILSARTSQCRQCFDFTLKRAFRPPGEVRKHPH